MVQRWRIKIAALNADSSGFSFIRHIECTGLIGSATNAVNFHAGYGLTELLCTPQINGVTAPRDAHSAIQSNFIAPLTGRTNITPDATSMRTTSPSSST